MTEILKFIDLNLLHVRQKELLRHDRAKNTLLSKNWGQIRSAFDLTQIVEFKKTSQLKKTIDALEYIKAEIDLQEKIATESERDKENKLSTAEPKPQENGGKPTEVSDKSRDKEQTTPETDIMKVNNDRKIEQIDEFCNWTGKLINYIKHPDKSREISKAKADALGNQVNSLAQKIWLQINFDETGWPYESADISEYADLYSESIFSIQPELKERIIERLQQWKNLALNERARARQNSASAKNIHIQNFKGILGNVRAENVQIGDNTIINKHDRTKTKEENQEGLLEPKPPEFLQKLLWILKYRKKHLKLILLATVIFVIWMIFAEFDLLSKIYTIIENVRP